MSLSRSCSFLLFRRHGILDYWLHCQHAAYVHLQSGASGVVRRTVVGTRASCCTTNATARRNLPNGCVGSGDAVGVSIGVRPLLYAGQS